MGDGEGPAPQLRCGQQVTGIQTDAQSARLTLAGGETLSARLVVAADSRHSSTRRAMGIAADMHDYGRTMLVCNMTHERPHEETAWEWFDHGQTLALLPMNPDPVSGRPRSSVVLTLPHQAIQPLLGLDEAAFGLEMTRRFGGQLGDMRLVSTRHAYPLVGVWARRFVAQRFAVVGDAAVGMHPVTAHGFNLGLRSIDTLSKALDPAPTRTGRTSHRPSCWSATSWSTSARRAASTWPPTPWRPSTRANTCPRAGCAAAWWNSGSVSRRSSGRSQPLSPGSVNPPPAPPSASPPRGQCERPGEASSAAFWKGSQGVPACSGCVASRQPSGFGSRLTQVNLHGRAVARQASAARGDPNHAVRLHQPRRLRPPRHGRAPPRVPGAPGCHQRPPAGQGAAGLHGPLRRAAGHRGTARPRPRLALRQGNLRCRTHRRPARGRPRHQHVPPHPAGRAARRRCGRAGHRPGAGRRSTHRLLQHPPARPPRRTLGRHGLLLLQQRGRRHPARAGRAPPGARGADRLRRAPRQWQRRHLPRRRAGADVLDLREGALPLQRRERDRPQHGQRRAAQPLRQRRLPRRGHRSTGFPRSRPSGPS